MAGCVALCGDVQRTAGCAGAAAAGGVRTVH